MSSAGRVDEGVVTQDDTTIDDGNDSLDAGYRTDTDPDVRAGTIAAMRRADEILVANGRGSRAKRAVERTRRFEDELNGNGTDGEEEEGPRRGRMNVGESVLVAVAARDEAVTRKQSAITIKFEKTIAIY
jgi:hypothetical protein